MEFEHPFQIDVREAFVQRFGVHPEVEALAPGRVNLIGEHTDYSEGFVLPFAIDRETAVVAARRDERGPSQGVCVLACDLGEEVTFEASVPAKRGGFGDYVRGVLLALEEKGFALGGVDVAVASRVPLESGLSSSAALSVGLVTAFDALFGFGLGARERARIAHRGESHFVATGCGILDPFASALGRRDTALRIDCRSQEVAPIPFPSDRAVVLVAHSGITRSLARGDYRERVAECRAAFTAADGAGLAPPGARGLRDFSIEDLPRLESRLDARLFRRVRHVLTENERVEFVCEALLSGNLSRVGELLQSGHASLAQDFEVSIPEIDALCEIADALPGVLGSRLTGAGFGGCTLHLVEPAAVDDVVYELSARFKARFGTDPEPICVRASDGARARRLA